MFILQCYQTKNRCYKAARAAAHIGILVHSTGAVNRNIKRYVDAPEVLGKNQYGNHWNKSEADKCMHAFIGYDKDNRIIVANTLPYQYSCWGCGKGSNGSYNYNPNAHIQFEICQGSSTDAEYYAAAIDVAAQYCAYLCREFGFDPFKNIVSHREAARSGYASNHGDPESWMKNFGDDMNRFRARVAAILDGETATPEIHQPITQGGGTATLRSGSKGAAVVAMQSDLMRVGYALPRYGADGSFGEETLTALKRFQADHDLAVDGVFGPASSAALAAAINALDTPPTTSEPEPETYSVTIPGLTLAEAAELLEQYPEATYKETA